MRLFPRLVASIAAFVVVLGFAASGEAQTAPRLAIEWGKTFERATDWLSRNSERGSSSEMLLRIEPSQTAPPSILGTAWFGAAPNVSFVARDWGQARSLAGGPLLVTDQLRLSRSSRMVVSRLRLSGGRLIPFAQLGVGQWRVDTDILPGRLRDSEVAVQVGTGLELWVTTALTVALESDLTQLCRDTREPQNLPTSRFWGGLAAARLQF